MITDSVVTLRAMEPEDTAVMYRWENDTSLWDLGDNTMPFSRNTILSFIESATQDIYTTKQLRLIIEVQGRAIGTADLFDFSPLYSRAAVGVLIYDSADRGKGYATRATALLCKYGFDRLKLEQLYVHIPSNNTASINMCTKVGFRTSGTLIRWCGDQDVIIMQLFK